MNKLEEARIIINSVDKQMIDLFKKRMAASKMVAEYKMENNLPVLDSSREALLIKANLEELNDTELEEFYLIFIRGMITASKDYQKEIIRKG